ncbi:MAG: ABC transporter substrate-binding protein [Rhizobiaceae bacterium]|nr:ABC transporter substrate-binding protein [Rhizobiaceae bacterium]
MTIRLKHALRGSMLGCALALTLSVSANAQDIIKIGEVSSFTNFPDHMGHYKNGMDLALDEINGAGGVDGKQLVFVTRDDKATAGDAIRAAEELVAREQVDAITGTFLSSVALAMNEWAKRNEVLFLATMSLSDKMIWQEGNRYGYRLRAGTFTQSAILAEKAAELGKKRWALVYPNYEFGQLAAENFKRMLTEAQPDVEFVSEHATPLGRIEAGGVAQAMIDAQPDAIFSVLFGGDLLKFVRAGTTQGLFEGREVLGLTTGEPENLEPLGADAPEGWWVTGYDWTNTDIPAHKKFLADYQERFGAHPGISAIMGYTTVKTMAAAFDKADSTETEAVVDAMAGLEVEMPWGTISYRSLDNQSTIGSFLGRTARGENGPVLVDAVYKNGEDYQPTEEMISKWRAATE